MLNECFGGKFDKAEATITELRKQRDSWSAADQRDHLCGLLGMDMDDQPFTPNSGSVCGMHCCDSHLLWCWNHSTNHFKQIKGLVARKQKDGRSVKKVNPDRISKFAAVKDWFGQMVSNLGCDSPNKDGSIFLHGFTLNGNLFPMLKANFTESGIGFLVPSKQYYNTIWQKIYGSAKAREIHNAPYVRLRGDVTVSKCAECQKLDLEIQQAKPGPERRAFNREKQHHLGFVYDQRVAYTAKRRSAQFGMVLSCGTDATSGWFTQLPMASEGTTAVRSWTRLDHKVTISVLHGCRGCHEYTARVCTPAWVRGGGNLQITIFFEAILKEIVDGWIAAKPAGTKLPDVLFMQVDRGSDMFNKQWLAVLSWWLEEKKYFRKIVLSALPVGHSHDDYDRLGAAFVRFIMEQDVGGALSSADLLRKLKSMKNSTGMFVADAFDFKSWVEPHIRSDLKKHRLALMWSLELDANGYAIASFAADCHHDALIGVFGRILTGSPDPHGPRVASRWDEVAERRDKKKQEWEKGVESVQKSVAAMSDAELSRFGYGGDGGKAKAVQEWQEYKAMGLSESATIVWPPPVLADIARLASTSVVGGVAVAPVTLGRPQVPLPPIPRTHTTGGGGAADVAVSADVAPAGDGGGGATTSSASTIVSTRFGSATDWEDSLEAAVSPENIQKPRGSGLSAAHLVLWDSGDGPQLWLATITQADGQPVPTTGLLGAMKPACGEITALSNASVKGTKTTHQVRVGWLSTVGGDGHLDNAAVVGLGMGNQDFADRALGARFARALEPTTESTVG
jgi:hypothetical protein